MCKVMHKTSFSFSFVVLVLSEHVLLANIHSITHFYSQILNRWVQQLTRCLKWTSYLILCRMTKSCFIPIAFCTWQRFVLDTCSIKAQVTDIAWSNDSIAALSDLFTDFSTPPFVTCLTRRMTVSVLYWIFLLYSCCTHFSIQSICITVYRLKHFTPIQCHFVLAQCKQWEQTCGLFVINTCKELPV